MTRPAFIWRNGQPIAADEACVGVLNPAIYGAYGVYESMQMANGVIFEPEAHLRRLARSAAILELALPAGLEQIGAWIDAVAEAADAPDCVIRLFVVGPDDDEEPNVYIWSQPAPRYPESLYQRGATAVTFEAQRFLPQAKSLNSLASYMAQRHARAAHAEEAFLYHDGCVTEGSKSSVFAVVDGELRTAPEADVLAGVTREIVIDLTRRAGIPFQEARLPLAEIGQWEECFITSTSRHVMPVSVIDGRPVGTGEVGPLTTRLAALFEDYFADSLARAR